MSSEEFETWKAFYLVEPFGSTREDHRFGVLAATFVNMFGKKSSKRVKPSDFFPEYKPRTQTWEQQLVIVEMLNAALGGTDKRLKAV
jgi:hypothetical protein